MNWFQPSEYDPTAWRAEVRALCVDGTPIVLLRLHANEGAYDVQDMHGHVLAYGPAPNVEDAKMRAQAAAYATLRSLLAHTEF